MKRLIFIAVSYLTSFHMLAAEYVPFVVEGKTWEVEYKGGYPMTVDPRTLRLDGDTLINGMTYKKLYETIHATGRSEYRGAFREVDRKVFFMQYSAHDEVLHYDFSLHVGDTFISVQNKGTDYEREVEYEM